MSNYVSKARVTKISATSRIAIKIKDNYYTVEYTEERDVPDVEDVNIEAEKQILFDSVNAIVDDQAEQILLTFQKR